MIPNKQSGPSDRQFTIDSMEDAARTVAAARALLADLGFTRGRAFLIATGVSELASNIVNHAGSGSIRLGSIEQDNRFGFQAIAEDSGPGIGDWEQACVEGYSSAQSLGLGLAGVLRIMDAVEHDVSAQGGARIRVVSWR